MKKVFNWFRSLMVSFWGAHCSLHAAGLTYFAMMALVPILCCVLVAAKAARVDEFARRQLNERIDEMITSVEKGRPEELSALTRKSERARERERIATEEFASQARQLSDQLFAKIERFDVRRLGLFGLAMLLWTVISSLGQVEVSLNEIWGIGKPRPIWKKAYLYLFVAIVVPIFLTLAMSLPILRVVKDAIVATMGATWLTKWVSDGLVWFIDSWICRFSVSICFSSLAFGYVFWVLPNCKVRFRHAWYGGLVASVLFAALLRVCAIAQVGIAKSSALYGSFAFFPIVLAWMYMSWQVVLFGACFAHSFVSLESEEKK